MSGQERAALVGIALGLLTNVALALALVPSLGVTGGAIAFAASLVVWNTAFTVIARRRVGINATALRALAMVDRRSRA
jgi:O-antigen/teichoic acid export membrane protein